MSTFALARLRIWPRWQGTPLNTSFLLPYPLRNEQSSTVDVKLTNAYRFKHAQAEFVKMAAQKLIDFNQKLRSKVKSAEIEKRLKILSEYFNRVILPGFQNSGKSWEIPFDLPGRTGGVSSRLTFTDSEVLSCLNPSVSMVRKMLEQTVALVQPQYEVTVSS
jgi:hypothetical protein